MNQKTWDKLNTRKESGNICACCHNNIITHKNYNDYRFCEECYKLIAEEYNKKKNNPEDKEQIEYFGWYCLENYLESVYDELKPLTYWQWAATQPI